MKIIIVLSTEGKATSYGGLKFLPEQERLSVMFALWKAFSNPLLGSFKKKKPPLSSFLPNACALGYEIRVGAGHMANRRMGGGKFIASERIPLSKRHLVIAFSLWSPPNQTQGPERQFFLKKQEKFF